MDEGTNPRVKAYAASQGMSVSEILELDAAKYPGGRITGFALWITEQKRAFWKVHPEAFTDGNIHDQRLWDEWLQRV